MSMTKPIDLSTVTNIVYGEGVPMPGCQLSDSEAIEWARDKYPNCEICVVRDWRWLDIEVSEEAKAGLHRRGIEPALVYANNVVHDTRRRWALGSWVKTSLLHRYHGDGAFLTLNTMYVLLGEGVRLTTTPEALRSLV